MSYLARLHIGNDVVMLTTANHSHWIGNSRKMDKVFTAEEQQQIEEAGQPPAMSWVLWSMKESAYKIFNQKTGVRIFAPNRFIAQITKINFLSDSCQKLDLASSVNRWQGKVNTPACMVYTQTFLAEEYLHTIAYEDTQQWDDIHYGLQKVPHSDRKYQSAKIRAIAAQHISRTFNTDVEKLRIQTPVPPNTKTAPQVQYRQTLTGISLSLSHDGTYLAYSFFLNVKNRELMACTGLSGPDDLGRYGLTCLR